MELALVILAAYLLGSLLPGLWIARLYGVDIRQAGSGNVGSTNVYRVLGFWPGFYVQLIDTGKAMLAVWIARWRLEEMWTWYAAATAAVLGHVYPIWAGFKGGKGINTLSGAMLVIEPLSTAAAMGVFLLTLGVSRYVSLSSIVAVSSFLLWHGLIGKASWEGYLAGSFWTVLVIYTHRSNLRRLWRGEEPRVGRSKASAPS